MTTALPRWTHAVVPWGRGATAFTGPRIVVFGLLWATAQTAASSYGLPIESLSAVERLRFEFEVFLSWALAGVLGAYVARRIATRFSLPMIVVTIVALSFGMTGVRYSVEAALGLGEMPFFTGRSLWAAYVFDAWSCLLYGGLFMLGCVFSLRSEQTRDLLGQAEIARSRSEAMLGEVELQTLRGHVDPGLLLRTMAEVQRRYADDATSADRLLEQLVNFLRRAMPAVRTGRSTLAAEVKLARAHVRLLAEIDPQPARWRIQVDPGLSELPFPPLLLLPVLDAVSAASLPGSTYTLAITGVDRSDESPPCPAIELRLDGPPPARTWLPATLERRLRVGLGAVFGDGWSLRVEAAAAATGRPLLQILMVPRHVATLPRPVSPPDLETHDE
ncbi:MAG: hypothetical protein ABIS28_11335 [Caldimonas sp.]